MSRSSCALLLGACVLASTGCVEFAMREALRSSNYEIPAPTPELPTAGAIWTGGSAAGSFLFYDRKARGPGDLVTVVIRENLAAQGSATTALDRKSAISADATSDLGFTDALQSASRHVFKALGFGNTGTPAAAGSTLNALNANQANKFDGNGQTQRKSSMTGVLTCRVVEALPGDVFRIQGRRQLLVNHELQIVTVEGLVRRQDIAIDNTVSSTQLADVRFTFDGIGVIDDKQRPPLVGRLLDWVLPF